MKFDIYKDNVAKAKSIGAKIRVVTEITSDNIHYCKELAEIIDELRHLDRLKGSIVISESEFMFTTTGKEKQLLNPIIYSREREFVQQQQYIFDIVWKKAMPFAQRILEIEEGITPEVIETMSNYTDIENKTFDILNSANSEILIVLSTSNAFHRLVSAGSFQKLKEIIDNKPGIALKILIPQDIKIEKMASDLGNNSNCNIRHIEPLSGLSILIVDRKYSLVAETKDDAKQTVTEAIDMVMYSNSMPTVLSYAVIFDNFWKQTELYEQLKKAHEDLLISDKIQKDFINTAAHELRTPIQPILGISKLLRNKTKDNQYMELLEVISRNAQKLKKLSEDILEVSKIEINLLNLHKEYFKINELITEVIKSFKKDLDTKRITFEHTYTDDLIVYADKNDIGRVMVNLISNSMKFIPQNGIISVGSAKKEDSNDDRKKVMEKMLAMLLL